MIFIHTEQTDQKDDINTIKQNVPYDKNEFSTRILFSNVSVTDSFTNGYRTFQGLSYQDYDKKYGPIVKLEP